MTPARVIDAPVPVVAANDGVGRTVAAMDSAMFGGAALGMLKSEAAAWLRRAQPGAELLYAIGCTPPVWAGAAKLLRDMEAAGVVALSVERPARGVKHYIARRSAVPVPATVAARPVLRPARADDQQRMLDLLIDHADDARPCPSNADLAAALELTDGLRASYLLGCLEASGAIFREASAWMPGRIVTIVASGRATGIMEGVRRK